MDFESETFITHSLRADGFDASEDGTGRGTPLVPVTVSKPADCPDDCGCPLGVCEYHGLVADPIAIQAGAVRENPDSGPDGAGFRDDGIAYTLEARGEVQAVAFDCKASGRNGFGIGDVSPTLRSMGHKDSHTNAGGPVAVMTLAIRGRDGEPTLEVREDGTANAVLTPNGGRGGIGVGAVAISANQRGELRERPVHGSLSSSKSTKQFDGIMQGMAVRRLTPRECERLQGFPDDYTLIRYHRVLKSGKLSKRIYEAADGPRYKALGNSMAVPVMRWIGERIQIVEGLSRV
jgi:DNA (cytosine-5)-methyltransferase 1